MLAKAAANISKNVKTIVYWGDATSDATSAIEKQVHDLSSCPCCARCFDMSNWGCQKPACNLCQPRLLHSLHCGAQSTLPLFMPRQEHLRRVCSGGTDVAWGSRQKSQCMRPAHWHLHAQGIKVYSWDDFYALGEGKPCQPVPPKPEDPATIMYTSGTTGGGP
jgi:acyl-CoA synthetase (AMP-forming)/AMP-acid ligase II